MKPLKIALQFLTIFPVTLKEMPDKKDFSQAMICFPVIGFLIGLTLAVTDHILSGVFPDLLLNVILVLLLTALTGALHLDGLADTVDGLASRKSREEALAIMRDSRIGAMGTLSLIFIILLKITLLVSLPANLKIPALIAMPCVGRWSMLVPLYLFGYARNDGKAKVFFDSMDKRTLNIATTILLVLVLITLKLSGLFALAAVAIFTFMMSKYLNKRIGGFTGDMLGAVNEVNEVSFLLIMLVIIKI